MSKQRALIYHNLSLMLDSGLPIVRALTSAVAGLPGPLARIWKKISKDVADGNSLAEAIKKHPKKFPPLDLLLIDTGENSGNIAEALDMLSNWYHFRNRTNSIILAGLMLPLLLIHATAAIAPVPTLFLGDGSSGTYLHQALSILALFYIPAAVILAVIFLTPKTGPIIFVFDSFTVKVPILGKALFSLAMSRFCRAFYMLFKAGVPITYCAQNSAEIAGNLAVKKIIKRGSKKRPVR